MKKFKSELLFTPIMHEDTLIGAVRNFVIDNENGTVLAIALDKECKKVIPFDQVVFFSDRFYAKERDSVFDSEDIIKINKIVSNNLNLDKQTIIETENNEVIGKLSDYSFNILLGTVSQIEATKTTFFLWKQVQLIDVNLIYEIEPNFIYIKTKSQKIKQKKAEPLLDPA